MAAKKKTTTKSKSKVTVTKTPTKTSTKVVKKVDPLFPPRPRSFRIGGDILPKRDLRRFVKWPRYIRIQRQRKILYQRLKVPPSINQFTRTLDKNQASELFRVLNKYRPESPLGKKMRLAKIAEAAAQGSPVEVSKPPHMVQYGLKHVTNLIESKKASLVVIASDVNPVELVLWLPALCRKMEVPYCIVKGKARLGYLVHKKTAAVVAITEVNKEDKPKLDNLRNNFMEQFNKNLDVLKRWGGGIMGPRTQHMLYKRQKALEAELAKKAQY